MCIFVAGCNNAVLATPIVQRMPCVLGRVCLYACILVRDLHAEVLLQGDDDVVLDTLGMVETPEL